MNDAVRPRLRRLSDEEIELWLSVAASVTRRAGAAVPERLAKPLPEAEDPPSLPGKARPAPVTAASSGGPPLAPLERKLKRKLARGRMTADAAIDLHGLRQAEAHAALLRFLQNARCDGARVVLVVTGKGMRAYGAPDSDPGAAWRETGVLRRSVPLWLGLPEFRALVLGFEEAGRPHGGAGALYVRLRRATGRGS